MLWRTLECFRGSTGERSWEINNLRIVRYKSTLKRYLMEGVWQILERQQ